MIPQQWRKGRLFHPILLDAQMPTAVQSGVFRSVSAKALKQKYASGRAGVAEGLADDSLPSPRRVGRQGARPAGTLFRKHVIGEVATAQVDAGMENDHRNEGRRP